MVTTRIRKRKLIKKEIKRFEKMEENKVIIFKIFKIINTVNLINFESMHQRLKIKYGKKNKPLYFLADASLLPNNLLL